MKAFHNSTSLVVTDTGSGTDAPDTMVQEHPSVLPHADQDLTGKLARYSSGKTLEDMHTGRYKADLSRLLALADIRINGNNPWDIHVHNTQFYLRVLAGGSLGAGEAYVAGWWDCQQLDEFFTRALKSNLEQRIKKHPRLIADIWYSKLFNRQKPLMAFRNAQRHYDIGNDLFTAMLDKRMNYSCAYWKDAQTLDDAQEHKLDLTCRKLQLQPGMRVLDIGCGWGSFARYAAEMYGVHVTGITVSEAQAKRAKMYCAGLPVEIRLMDYRQLTDTYHRIVSIGMLEHVGHKNYRRYMQLAQRCLTDDGLFVLHTIGSNTSGTYTDPWIDKYIFPGSLLPSIRQIGRAIEGLFVMEDWHNFSADYDRTLLAWYENFVRAWPDLQHHYDEVFFRIWEYYLLMCAGTFRARKNQLWQIVLSKHGVPGGYVSLR